MTALAFAEPIGRLEDLKDVVRRLAEDLCRQLRARGEGVRRLDLILRRVDQKSAGLRVGTAKATSGRVSTSRKLFDERLQTVDPGFGIEEMVLVASKVEPLAETQIRGTGHWRGGTPPEADMSRLVDRLGARLGAGTVYRLAPVQSLVARADDPEGARARATERVRPGRRTCRGRRACSIRRSPWWRPRCCPIIRRCSLRLAQGPSQGRHRPTARSASRPNGGRATRTARRRDYYRVETEQGGRLLALPRRADRRGRALVAARVLRDELL